MKYSHRNATMRRPIVCSENGFALQTWHGMERNAMTMNNNNATL
jgi:hypothetical protein